jgi:hypothetical protein
VSCRRTESEDVAVIEPHVVGAITKPAVIGNAAVVRRPLYVETLVRVLGAGPIGAGPGWRRERYVPMNIPIEVLEEVFAPVGIASYKD